MSFELNEIVNTPLGYATYIKDVLEDGEEKALVQVHGLHTTNLVKLKFLKPVDKNNLYVYKTGDRVDIKYYGEVLEDVRISGYNKNHLIIEGEKINFPMYVVEIEEERKDLITINEIII